jgi:hypothetical protein
MAIFPQVYLRTICPIRLTSAILSHRRWTKPSDGSTKDPNRYFETDNNENPGIVKKNLWAMDKKVGDG